MTRRSARQRKGSAYVLVLMVSLIVVVIGLSSIAVARIETQAIRQSGDARAAEVLALSAVEQATTIIRTSSTWRDDHTHGEPTEEIALGGGLVSYRLEDETGDEDLAAGDSDPVKVFGIGRVGDTVRIHSVRMSDGGDLGDVFQTALHAAGPIQVAKSITVVGGPLSTNATLTRAGWTITGDVAAAALAGYGTITGAQDVPAASKSMPPPGVFDFYQSQGESIAYATLPLCCLDTARTLSGTVTGASNPWGATNIDGIYHIEVPDGATLRVDSLLLVGTLLITAGNGSLLSFGEDVHLEPSRIDHPVLIARGAGSFNVLLEGGSGSLSVDPGYGQGYQGLMHVIGGQSLTEIDANFSLFGLLVTEGQVLRAGGATNATLTHDPRLSTEPPRGYGGGAGAFQVVSGSWRWEVTE